MTLRKVANISEAIDIINENGSHHTDCIVTSDPEKAETIMFVSHSADTVVDICQQGLWLERGEVKMMGTAKEVAKGYTESR